MVTADIIHAEGKPAGEINVADLKIVIALLSQNEDGEIPKYKKNLLEKLVGWQARVATIVPEAVAEEELADLVDEEAANNEENNKEEVEIDGFGYDI